MQQEMHCQEIRDVHHLKCLYLVCWPENCWPRQGFGPGLQASASGISLRLSKHCNPVA